jgi:hypothetical protein
MTTDWLFQPWEHDRETRAQRVWDEVSGGWIVMTRDDNGAFSAAWKPDVTIWASAIGQAVVAARAETDDRSERPR